MTTPLFHAYRTLRRAFSLGLALGLQSTLPAQPEVPPSWNNVFSSLGEPTIETLASESSAVLRVLARETNHDAVLLVFDLHALEGTKKTLSQNRQSAQESLKLNPSDRRLLLSLIEYANLPSVPSGDPYVAGLDGADVVLEVALDEKTWQFYRWMPFQRVKQHDVNAGDADPFGAETPEIVHTEKEAVDERLNILLLGALCKGKATAFIEKLK